MSLLPPPLPPNNPPYVSLTNHPASYPTCGCCSLQHWGFTALTLASENGHTEIALALLAVAGIDVNHASTVSISPLIPSHVVVGNEGGTLPPNNTPYVSVTHPASYPTCGCCSLQREGSTALTLASGNGHTEIILALLAAAGINVNQAEHVSIYPLTPSHVVVGCEGGGGLPPLPPHPNRRTN